MERIAEVEVRKADKPVFCRVPDDVAVQAGDQCIFEAGQGHLESGRILKFLDPKAPLRPPTAGKVVRKMSPEDFVVVAENMQR